MHWIIAYVVVGFFVAVAATIKVLVAHGKIRPLLILFLFTFAAWALWPVTLLYWVLP
jgi:hypothetical protein